MKNKILIVTGMHRSHTSLASQWLHKCGLNLGDQMLGAGNGNDDGHFEDFDFLNAHQAILQARRLSVDGFCNALGKLSHNEFDRLHDIITYKNSMHQQWGWKEPRTCLFLDGYRELAPSAFYFVVVRDFQSVVSSLVLRMFKKTDKKYASRKGISKLIWVHYKRKRRMEKLLRKYCQYYLKSWITYNEAILEHLQQLRPNQFLVANFNTLYHHDQLVFDHMVQQWGISLKYAEFRGLYKNKLQHNSTDIIPYIKDKPLLERAAQLERELMNKSVFGLQPVVAMAV